MLTRSALLLALLAAPALAQSGAASNPARAPHADAHPAAWSPETDLRANWRSTARFLSRAATAVPESSYSYRPVATVRTLGQILAHVAGSQRMFCAAVLGETMPAEDDIEKKTLSKAELVKALDESTTYCERAYAAPPAQLGATLELFGQHFTRGGLLILNATHDDEHYGNIVTYMRMLGMVPPSSQPAR